MGDGEKDPGNPWQREEDRSDDEAALFRLIYALRDDADRTSIIAEFLRRHEGDKTDVSSRRIRNFVREARKSVRRGGL